MFYAHIPTYLVSRKSIPYLHSQEHAIANQKPYIDDLKDSGNTDNM